MSGRREVSDDEKAVLSELTRMIHVVKTGEKQRKVIQRASKRRQEPHANPDDTKKQAARKSKRRSLNTNGGSIWLRFSPCLQDASKCSKEAGDALEKRVQQSQRKREAALSSAAAYYASAVAQAREAGLADAAGRAVSTDGVQYLQEQYAIAQSMLSVPMAGSHHAKILSLAAPDAGSVTEAAPESISDASYRSCLDWAMQQIVKERSTLKAPGRTEDEEASIINEAALPVEEAARQLVSAMRFHMQPPSSISNLCIMKIKGPGGKKTTTFINTQKGATNLKNNLSLLLKKEMLPLLPKSAIEATATACPQVPSPSKAPSGAKVSAGGNASSQKGQSRNGRK